MSREIPIVVRTDSGWLRMPSLFTIAALLAMAFSAFMAFTGSTPTSSASASTTATTTIVNRRTAGEGTRLRAGDD